VFRTWPAGEKVSSDEERARFGVRRQRRRFGFLSISASTNPKRRRAALAGALQNMFFISLLRTFVFFVNFV
jgi:hypothetical protein